MPIRYKLSDGREMLRGLPFRKTKTIRCPHCKGVVPVGKQYDEYILEDSIVVARKCFECKEYLPVESFSMHTRRNGFNVLGSICSACKYELNSIRRDRDRIKNGKRSKLDPKCPRSFLESRFCRVDGVVCLGCIACLANKPLSEFRYVNGKIQTAVCRECRKKKELFYHLRGCFRKRFGEDSPQLKKLQDEGWKGSLEKMREMLKIQGSRDVSGVGVFVGKGLRKKVRRMPRGTIVGMGKQKVRSDN